MVDGVHDLGGLHGFSRVKGTEHDVVFNEEWERRAFGLGGVVITLMRSSLTAVRAAIERMDPVQYLSSPYYEHVLTATATLLVTMGTLTQDELVARAGGPFPLSAGAPPNEMERGVEAPFGRQRFSPGDLVRVRDISPAGHTRCPRYVRRRKGTVVRVNSATALPDLEAATGERILEASYCVRFAARELWGKGDWAVLAALWDSYLEPA